VKIARPTPYGEVAVLFVVAGIGIFVALAFFAACGGGHGSSKASMVCRQTHENTKLFAAFVENRPFGSIPNPTPATVVTHRLGNPDQKLATRDAGVFWWRYADTAYLIAESMQSTPAHDLVLAKACNWKFTQKRLGG
jgi:hypothetical protein